MTQRAEEPQKKLLFMEKFISILLIFRQYFTQIPSAIYLVVIIGFMIGKYVKQGNTIGSLGQYISLLFILIGEASQIEFISLIGVIFAVLSFIFLSPTLFSLPVYYPKVGLRDNLTKRNNKQIYWVEWYPVEQNQSTQYKISWNHTVEMDKMAEYMGLNHKYLAPIFKFFVSSINKYELSFVKGNNAPSKGYILFSHGRTGTPFLYSSILKNLARKWVILSPQHSQVKSTPYTKIEQIKKFRQSEVKERSQEIVFLAQKIPEKQRIVLMGHSYGCATILQAYKSLKLSIRKRVSHIVLYDPWLFPLSVETFQDQIVCPILMLANQHFIDIQDIYNRNLSFIKRQGSKMTYICWSGGDHLHQTDMPFVVGSSLNQIKNAIHGGEHLQRNLDATHIFLDEEIKKEQLNEVVMKNFGIYDLGKDYKPSKWKNSFSF